jgi:hypothetical protein
LNFFVFLLTWLGSNLESMAHTINLRLDDGWIRTSSVITFF